MNASSLQKFSERAAQVGESLWPVTVRINGTDYPGECPRPPREKAGLDVGFGEQNDARVVRIRKTVLANPPALHSFVTMDNRKWQVRSIGGENSVNAAWSLHLEAKK